MMGFGAYWNTPRPKRTLKAQLVSSFGLAALVSLLVVVLASCGVVWTSGQQLLKQSENLMIDQVENRLATSSELFAMSGRAAFVEESLEILVESVRDRIAGYPSLEGWEEGHHVPFAVVPPTDNDGSPQPQRGYPLNQPPVPLDWQVTKDIDTAQDIDALDYRLRDYPAAISSTKTASYRLPSTDQPVNQTELQTTDGIYRATGDLSVMLKSMFEAIPEALATEIHFFRGGAGSSLQFPAREGADGAGLYESPGCDWTTQLTNPYTHKPYATESPCFAAGTVVPSRFRNPMEHRNVRETMEHTARQFAQKSSGGTNQGLGNQTKVPPTRAQKEQRDKVMGILVHWEGPLRSSKDNETIVLTASKAIFDRITSEFIGVVTIEILESGLADDLRRRILDDDSDVYTVFAIGPVPGVIVGSTPDAEHEVFEVLPEYDDIQAAFTKSYRDRIPEWEAWRSDPEAVKPEALSATYFNRTHTGGFLVSVPIPPVPEVPWDNPNYEPIGFVVQKIPPTIFHEFDVFADRVREDVRKNIILCIVLGIIGLVLVLLILAIVSKVLSQPLTWIAIVARKIIKNDFRKGKTTRPSVLSSINSELGSIITSKRNLRDSVGNGNSGKHHGKKRKKRKKNKRNIFSSTSRKYFREGNHELGEIGVIGDDDSILMNDPSGMNRDLESNISDYKSNISDYDEVGFVNFDYDPEENSRSWCILSTELQQLLEDFQSMIHGFSGDGVSEVAEPGLCEIQNSLTWHSDFSKLYQASPETAEGLKKLSSVRQISGATIGSAEAEELFWSKTKPRERQVTESTRNTSSGSKDGNQRDTSHKSRVSWGKAERMPPEDQPEFRSNVVRGNQDSSEEPPPQNQNRSSSNQSLGITLPGPPTVVPAPMKINRTSTLRPPKLDPRPKIQQQETPFQQIKRACKSRLFWMIVLLMALPIFVTNFVIGAIVSSSILKTLPTAWTESAKQGSNNIERDAMQLIADRKAAIVSNMIRGPVRDAYLMTRVTNWLIFGGIERSNATMHMDSTSESCKDFPAGECPFSSPCSCDWDYGWNVSGGICDLDGSTIDSRYLQKQWFEVQKTDSDPITGSRLSSPSYPASLNSPENTLWWNDISSLPGSEAASTGASGYKTMYDRAMVSSASAVFNFPIYNYPSGVRRPRTSFGGYVAFEEDGLQLGWSGCDDWHSSAASFVSTFENGASLIDNDLCADGKYGYDPRCQGWYQQGRESYLVNDFPAHVTPPYRDALSGQIKHTITSPIANPTTGEYVGQVALDFKLNYELVAKMLDGESSLTFMITPHEDILGGDMVVSPGSEKGWASAKIEDFIFANETNRSNSDHFKSEVLPLMKAGKRGNTMFSMTNKDGVEEEICLYYTPVKVPLSLGLKPDNFASGEETIDHLIYSLGVGIPCNEIKRPYDGVEDSVNKDMKSQQGIFVAIIVTTTLLFVVFSAVTAVTIASPMIKLSNIVKNAKKGEYDSIPPLEGGCKEVQSVYNTFAKLNKIVRISNTSFFSGKLKLAQHFMADALLLYRKINDRKAIGVTCNNLANTLFALQYENMDDVNCCDLTKECHVRQALDLYDEAVLQSQLDFDHEEDDLKVQYGIQLADRLFNRGLYYLFIDGYECAPQDSRDRGYNDITFSRNLHDDIRDYMLEKRQLFAKASPYFSRLLRRINCLAAFYDDIGLRDIWDAKALLEEANQLVSAALEASSSGKSCPLFEEVNRSGRQQQLESLKILLSMNSGDNLVAAKTGMRMFVEDSYLMESAFIRAAEALLRLIKEGDDGWDSSFSKRSIQCTRDDLRAMVKSCKKESLEIGKNAIFVFEIAPSRWKNSNKDTDNGELLDELNSQCLWLYDNFCQADDQIGIVANTVSDTQSLGCKEDNEGRQRTFLDVATSIGDSGPPSTDNNDNQHVCFPIGLQMLIDSAVSLQSDSYIIWVTDGSVRHGENALISLRDKIQRLNQERSYQIHVFIIDLDTSRNIDGENAEKILLGDIGSVTKQSLYLTANSKDELASAFEWGSGVVFDNRVTSEIISFLTMEKF